MSAHAFNDCIDLTSTACVLSRALRRTQGRPLKPLTVMNAQVDAHVSASENANEVCNWDKLSQRQKKGFRLENNKDNVIMIGDEQSLKDCIYVIRGQQVVLDYDLAKI